jgi:hypothetical protein
MYKVGINALCQQYKHVPMCPSYFGSMLRPEKRSLANSASGDMRVDPTIRTGSPAQIVLSLRCLVTLRDAKACPFAA